MPPLEHYVAEAMRRKGGNGKPAPDGSQRSHGRKGLRLSALELITGFSSPDGREGQSSIDVNETIAGNLDRIFFAGVSSRIFDIIGENTGVREERALKGHCSQTG